VTTEERAIDPEARLQHALDLSYRYLGFRDRTVVEVRRHLEHKRVEPDTIDAAVAELCRLEYLDDARFARRYAEDRRALDAWGTDRIERKLRAAGVDTALIAAALEVRDGEGELDAALALLHRRMRGPLDSERERERALGLLVRKGYELELAYDAVRAYTRASAA
jgi:regulatory protein